MKRADENAAFVKAMQTRRMSFATILTGLRDNDVRFVVVGGLAGTAHGSRRVTDDVDICYDLSTANIERLAALLVKWTAYPRGIEPGLPFFMDARQFRTTPIMTLTTREGFIDVLDIVKEIGALLRVPSSFGGGRSV